MVGNQNGQFMGWRPWHYEGDRLVRKKVTVSGGEQKAGATVTSWQADLFIPFALFKGLAKLPVPPGTLWRGNACRMDFDESPRAKWTLFPQTNGEFHRFEEFGTFRFE